VVRLLGLCVALAGCGRIGFDLDAQGDSTASHDEDGDGVPDAFDNCPATIGPQTDTDGDGVGDVCDWEPTTPRQHVVLFATMQPGDQPLNLTDSVEQLADAIRVNGSIETMTYAHPFADVSIEIGVDIEAVQSATKQLQFAMNSTNATLPDTFFEINEIPGIKRQASITRFASTYSSLENAPLQNGVHAGRLTMKSVQIIGGTDVLDVTLDSEHYHLENPGSPYDGGTQLFANVNNLTIAVRYVFVVAGS
jgi:hypothetical protein